MELGELREEISKIDREMAKLFEARMEAARGVAEYKRERGLPVEDREQEARVIDSKSRLIADDRIRSYYVQFIQSTMDISKRWQRQLLDGQRIACCAAEGTADYAAAEKIFPDGVPVTCADIDAAYQAVVSGDCDAAVLPFERSYSGEVSRLLDLIFSGNLHVNGIFDSGSGPERTRYAVLSQVENTVAAGKETDSFLLMFTVKDEVGGLAKAINTISAYNFNMRIMRSRPMSDLPWHYYFYAEAEGDDNSENGRRMLTALRAVCPMVKVAGRYAASMIEDVNRDVAAEMGGAL